MDSFKQGIQAILLVLKLHFISYWKQWITALVVVAILFGGYTFLFSPPADFPSGSIITIARGTSAPLVAKEFGDANIIKHPTLLKFLLRVSGTSDSIHAGTYRFKTPQDLFGITYRIITGEYGIPTPRLTFPEGTTVSEMATQISKAIPSISTTDFLKAGKPYEGYLFPDTYFFPLTSDAVSIVKTMRDNFNTKMESIFEELADSRHSISDIVTMASVVEKEARTSEDRRIISGILWNRISIGMPLQVDAAPDTYRHRGFPSEPICNPGLDSIEAALNPIKTKYLYYLTGTDGLMHYATTFAEHQANLQKYL